MISCTMVQNSLRTTSPFVNFKNWKNMLPKHVEGDPKHVDRCLSKAMPLRLNTRHEGVLSCILFEIKPDGSGNCFLLKPLPLQETFLTLPPTFFFFYVFTMQVTRPGNEFIVNPEKGFIYGYGKGMNVYVYGKAFIF
jgi:hypothetical protein